ncbi:MAG: dTDP-glucose 4,6-dehydratase [Chthoniobacterales bacterium]|nr:dTDP-glucose 4,6-dehydratase [Chthoniobacterales bacterium]
MNLLITGGAGFIGSNFVHYWREVHPADRLVVLDALTYAGNRSSLPQEDANFLFVHGDIRDRALVGKLLNDHHISVLAHFAAESHVDRSIHSPETFLDTNITGTLRLLEAAREYVASGAAPEGFRFHHVSTDEVYGSLGPEDPAFEETTPYAPNSPYAASKAASDHLVRAWHHTYGLPVTITNCSNNYGPYHFPEKLIPLMLVNILHGRPLPVYGDGMNVRDWLYVTDHCRGIEGAIRHGTPGEVYNIGGNNERPNKEIIRTLCTLIVEEFAAHPDLARRFPACPAADGRDPFGLVTHVTDRPGHDRRYAINAEKARRELGYEPKESLASGLKKTVRWYLENETWWKAVMDGSYQNWIASHYGDGAAS